jgi:hypothetical protein
MMDCRVKPGNDKQSELNESAITSPILSIASLPPQSL